jgi:hypothetical protein
LGVVERLLAFVRALRVAMTQFFTSIGFRRPQPVLEQISTFCFLLSTFLRIFFYRRSVKVDKG